MTLTTRITRRETLSSIRRAGKSKAIMLELDTTYLRIRLKGERGLGYTVTYDQIYMIGARNHAEALRKERAEARRSKKGDRNA